MELDGPKDEHSDIAAEAFRRLNPKAFYRKYLEHSIRPDGRRLLATRELRVDVGSISTADGSAFVKLGRSAVVAGVQLEVTTPSQESPGEGEIDVQVLLWPFCAPKRYRAGASPEKSFSVADFLKQTISSAQVVDMGQLCIKRGSACWILKVSILCLDDDGNFADAALIALVAALRNTKIPACEISDEECDEGLVNIVDGGPSVSLRVKHCPIPLTFGHFAETDTLISDPTSDEESLVDTLVTIVLNEDSSLVSFYVPGGGGVSVERLRKCVAVASGLAPATRSNLDRAFG
eukprot:g2034.t1